MVLLGIGYVLALFLIAGVLLWAGDRVKDALWRRSNPPEKLAAMRATFARRLISPDWTAYAEYLKRPIPPAMRHLFEQRDILLRGDPIELDNATIVQFEPLDAEAYANIHLWWGTGAMPFASRDGDPIYLRSGRDQSNAVYITYHDGGDTEMLSPDIEQFVAALLFKVK